MTRLRARSMFTFRVVPGSLIPQLSRTRSGCSAKPATGHDDVRRERLIRGVRAASSEWSPCPIEDGMRRRCLSRSLLGAPLIKQHGIRAELGWLSEVLPAGLPGTADRLVRAPDAVLDRN